MHSPSRTPPWRSFSRSMSTICPSSSSLSSSKLLQFLKRICSIRLSIVACILFIITFFIYKNLNFVGYVTRPLWDSSGGTEATVNHYFYGYFGPESCDAHGWKQRSSSDHQPRLFDAVIFSDELDMLELHLAEVYDAIDAIIIAESDTTFSGKSKPMHFANALALEVLKTKKENSEQRTESASGANVPYGLPKHLDKENGRFGRFSDKIFYWPVTDMPTGPSVTAWDREDHQRTSLLEAFRTAGLSKGDLFMIADVDEIPSAQALQLAKHCQIRDVLPLTLRMEFFYYSFEWIARNDGWVSLVVQEFDGNYGSMSRFPDGRQNHALSDAGWHCSWCFQYLSQFAKKMESYSHTEHDEAQFKDPQRIQKYICEGRDLFDRYPEYYTMKDVLTTVDGTMLKRFSSIHLPLYLQQNADRFRYMLPGNCRRRITA